MINSHTYYAFKHNKCFGTDEHVQETCDFLRTAYAVSFPQNPSIMDGISVYYRNGVRVINVVRDLIVYEVSLNGTLTFKADGRPKGKLR